MKRRKSKTDVQSYRVKKSKTMKYDLKDATTMLVKRWELLNSQSYYFIMNKLKFSVLLLFVFVFFIYSCSKDQNNYTNNNQNLVLNNDNHVGENLLLTNQLDCQQLSEIVANSHSEGLSHILSRVNSNIYFSTLNLNDTIDLNILIDSIRLFSYEFMIGKFGNLFNTTYQSIINSQQFNSNYFIEGDYSVSDFPTEVNSIIINIDNSYSLSEFERKKNQIENLLITPTNNCYQQFYLAVLNDSFNFWANQEIGRKCKFSAGDAMADAAGAYDGGVFGGALGGPVGAVFGAINGAIIGSSVSFLLGCCC